MLLFNISDFLPTHKYIEALNSSITSSSDINSITKIPPNDNRDIKSLFKINCSSINEIDKNPILKLLTLNTKEVLIELYNFEQAFIIQLKVFLLFNYIKLYKDKKNVIQVINSTTSTNFWTNFKKNFDKYYLIVKTIIDINVNKISQIQKINTSYMVSSSTGVISYCIKNIPPARINRITDTELDNEMSILEAIYLTTNLKEGSSVGDPDDKLIKHFKKIISSNTLAFEGKSSYTISDTNNVTTSSGKKKAKIMGLINLPNEAKSDKKLFVINNAANVTGIGNFFCPFSSILDGQATCKSYNSAIEKGNPIEDGETNVLVRDGFTSSVPETMRYHVRVKKSATSSEWNDSKRMVEISAYLKIGDKILINIGWENEPTYNHKKTDGTGAKVIDPDKGPDPVFKVNLIAEVGEKSPFDAKGCITNIIDNNIKLLTNTDNTLKTWDGFLNIINSDGADVDTKGFGTISRDLFRRKIIQTSFIKSLGDYLQEINTVADNGGYIGTPTSTTADGNNVLLPPNNFRLGLSNDRPSGVRIASFLLFGLSGINPKAIGGFYTISEKGKDTGNFTGNFVIASSDKGLLKNSGQVISGGSINKKIMRKSRKRVKGITNKRKKLLKNRKISKRNIKGTRKRK